MCVKSVAHSIIPDRLFEAGVEIMLIVRDGSPNTRYFKEMKAASAFGGIGGRCLYLREYPCVGRASKSNQHDPDARYNKPRGYAVSGWQMSDGSWEMTFSDAVQGCASCFLPSALTPRVVMSRVHRYYRPRVPW